MHIQLNHDCGNPEAKGMPGDIVDAPEAIAKELIARGGATIVIVKSDRPATESAVVAPTRNAATRTGKPAARKEKTK